MRWSTLNQQRDKRYYEIKYAFSKTFVIKRLLYPKILCTFSCELLYIYVLCSNLNWFVCFCSLSHFCNHGNCDWLVNWLLIDIFLIVYMWYFARGVVRGRGPGAGPPWKNLVLRKIQSSINCVLLSIAAESVFLGLSVVCWQHGKDDNSKF